MIILHMCEKIGRFFSYLNFDKRHRGILVSASNTLHDEGMDTFVFQGMKSASIINYKTGKFEMTAHSRS